jgi:hypothetical protein
MSQALKTIALVDALAIGFAIMTKGEREQCAWSSNLLLT